MTNLSKTTHVPILEHDIKLILKQLPGDTERGEAIYALQKCEGDIIDAIVFLQNNKCELTKQELNVLSMCPVNTSIIEVQNALKTSTEFEVMNDIMIKSLLKKFPITKKLAEKAILITHLDYNAAVWFIEGFLLRDTLSEGMVSHLKN